MFISVVLTIGLVMAMYSSIASRYRTDADSDYLSGSGGESGSERWYHQLLLLLGLGSSMFGGGVHGSSSSSAASGTAADAAVDLNWYPPAQSHINNLTSVINSEGVYGFIYNSSDTPEGVEYGTYNWCNMPHVQKDTYVVVEPRKEYELVYVEVVRSLSYSN